MGQASARARWKTSRCAASGAHAERTFERQLEQILRIPFRQPDQRIGDDRFIQRVGHRGDTGLDDANGKALGNAVDLLAKSRLKPLAGKPDLDEWPLANRQIWLEIQRLQVIAKVGQTHIAGLWAGEERRRGARSGCVQTRS